MVTELSNAFLYAQSACELWKEIRERYGQSNGPLSVKNRIKQDFLRSQILAMDPLLTINKAYYIVQQIEKQKQVTNNVFEPTAFFANMNNKNNSNERRENNKGNMNEIKLWYPDWYKGKEAKKNNRLAAHVNSGFDEHFSGETPFDMGYENEVSLGQNGHVDQKLVAAVYQEMMKMFIGKAISEDKEGASSSHVAVTVRQKDKFDNRGIKCVLLGYPMNKKCIKLYNLQTQEVFNSRDVVFKEDVFPFKDFKKLKGSLFVHDFPSFGDEFYPETTQTPLPSDPAVVIPNTHIPPDSDNENSGNENSDSSTNSIPQNVNSIPPKPTMRSTRQSTRPVWLKDFIALLAPTNVFAQPEPTRYQQAIQHPGWVEAINKELEALEKNNTCTLTELTSGHKAITSKWVYKTKFKPTGIIERLKARLVVRGFNQKEGLDYKHTFSPVAKLATVRVSIAIATAKEWTLHQLDINNAFLHGFINEEIYMLPPKDDVLITGNTPTETDSLKKSLDDKFTIKDIGLAKYFLDVHLHDAIYLLKYLKGTASQGLFYPIQPHLQVIGFTDADWTSCLMTRKLLTGYCIFLGHSLVSWKTKKQAIASSSSTEAEYRSIATTTCELLWLSFLLKDLHIPIKLPITLFCDNKSEQQIAANPCFHERTKHMDIDSHFTKEKVHAGFLQNLIYN
nr:copia protein [Tanacetum cinerariifolium]